MGFDSILKIIRFGESWMYCAVAFKLQSLWMERAVMHDRWLEIIKSHLKKKDFKYSQIADSILMEDLLASRDYFEKWTLLDAEQNNVCRCKMPYDSYII